MQFPSPSYPSDGPYTEALQDMCIIRRSPSPVPLERRPKDQLTREELLELLNRRSVCFLFMQEACPLQVHLIIS